MKNKSSRTIESSSRTIGANRRCKRMSATDERRSKIRNPCTSRGCCALFFFGKSALLGFRSALRRSDLVIQVFGIRHGN